METYIPLYRKYRPQAFADVVAQTPVVQTLCNAIAMNKVAHAYLFCGPRGTGKTSMARIFAKSLNCEQGPTQAPCQTCASCMGITQGQALDVIEFDAASNNSVDDARELIENCQFAPMAGRFKVYIIDEVHMLTSQAFNALLKTLEEPPPNVVFVFATTEVHKVLPTIISRCQRFDFHRLTTPDIVGRLKTVAQAEAILLEDNALTYIARQAKGGLRDALGLLDQMGVLAKAQTQPNTVLTVQDVTRFVGALEEDCLFTLVQAIAQQNASAVWQQLQTLSAKGIEPRQLVKELTEHFRNVFIVKTSYNPVDTLAESLAEPLGVSVETLKALSQQAELFSSEELPQILANLAALDRSLRNSQTPQLWLEIGVLELTYRETVHQIQQLAGRVQALESQLKAQPPVKALGPQKAVTPLAPVAPTPTQEQMSVMPTARGATAGVQPAQAKSAEATSPDWALVVQKVASPTTRSLVQQHTFLLQQMEGDRLLVGCSSEPTLSLLKKPDKLVHLKKAVEAVYGRPMSIEFVLEKEGKPKPSLLTTPPKEETTVSSPLPKPEPERSEPGIHPTVEASVSQGLASVDHVPDDHSDHTPTNEPSLFPEENHSETVPVAEVSPLLQAPLRDVDNPELAEAKQATLTLLQGKLLE